MAYGPISHSLLQYEDYPNYWLKAYEQGTTTALSLAITSAGGSAAAKFQLNANGFPVTAGNVRTNLYVNGAYDLWLFPTEAEADADDTANAIQLADNMYAASDVSISSVQNYATLTLLKAAITAADAGKVFTTTEHTTGRGYEGGNSYLVIAGTITDDNGSLIQGTVDTSVYLKALFPNGRVSVAHFGAGINDGATDEGTIFQTAIDYCGLNGIRTCWMEGRTYRINTRFDINYPVVLEGQGFGNPTDEVGTVDGVTVLDAGSALTGVTMIRLYNLTSGMYLSGAGVKNVYFKLNGICGSIRLNTCEHCVFENIYAGSANGVWVTHNMLLSLGSRFNEFRNIYLSGTNDIISLWLDGRNTPGGCTQNKFYNMTIGFGTANGTGVEGGIQMIGDVDNNIFYHVHTINGGIDPATSGLYGLSIQNGPGPDYPRNNVFFYLIADVIVGSATYANRAYDLGAETGSVTVTSGGNFWYTVTDQATGGHYQFTTFHLTEKKTVSIGEMSIITGSVSSPVVGYMNTTDGEGRVPSIDFAGTNSESVGFSFAPPDTWSSGTINGLRVFYSNSTAGAGNDDVRLNILICSQPALTTGTPYSPDYQEEFTATVNAANALYLHYVDLNFATPPSFTAGEFFSCRILRNGGAGGDTYTGLFKLLGVQVLYDANGPGASGAGPWEYGSSGAN